MSKNITAYTSAGVTYPEYVSINERGDLVEITVRHPAAPDGTCGATAAINMTRHDFGRLIAEACVWLEERGR